MSLKFEFECRTLGYLRPDRYDVTCCLPQMNAKMKLLLLVVLLAFAHLRSIEAAAAAKANSKTCLARQDLAFVVDASSSICNGGNNSYVPEGPCDNWSKCIKFLLDLVTTMTIGPDDIQVACIVFSTHSKVLWDFKR